MQEGTVEHDLLAGLTVLGRAWTRRPDVVLLDNQVSDLLRSQAFSTTAISGFVSRISPAPAGLAALLSCRR